jgi:hypothetical protein
VLSIVPIISVTSRVLFAAKILGVVALFNLIGLAIYLLGRHASGEAP